MFKIIIEFIIFVGVFVYFIVQTEYQRVLKRRLREKEKEIVFLRAALIRAKRLNERLKKGGCNE